MKRHIVLEGTQVVERIWNLAVAHGLQIQVEQYALALREEIRAGFAHARVDQRPAWPETKHPAPTPERLAWAAAMVAPFQSRADGPAPAGFTRLGDGAEATLLARTDERGWVLAYALEWDDTPKRAAADTA